MTARHDALFEVEFNDERTVLDILNAIGHMPLPPYIERPDEEADRELYQTVYSQKPGAVAAPTAGLHFDEPLLEKLRAKGIEMAFVTLHVGAGTFQPVRVDSIEDHIMHSGMPKCRRRLWMRCWRRKRAEAASWPSVQRRYVP